MGQSILPVPLTDLNGALLYAGYDGIHGLEVWRTDGTQAGTSLVKDINPGAADSIPDAYSIDVVVLGQNAYFAADDGVHGVELWKTDGTAAGTAMVRDLCPGTRNAHATGLFTFKGNLYFTAIGPDEVTSLWRTDGSANFVRVCDTSDTDGITSPTIIGNTLYFNNQYEYQQFAIYKSDGTAAGTAAIPGQTGDGFGDAPLATDGTRLYVVSWNSGVWKIDPSTGGLTKLAGGAKPVGALNGRLLFYTVEGDPYEHDDVVTLLATDGTSVGTSELWSGVYNSYSDAPDNQFTVVGGAVLYNGTATTGDAMELWRTDGTVAGTRLVKAGVFSQYGAVSNLTAHKGKLAFVDGIKLWTSDGTAAGTVVLADLPTPPYETEAWAYSGWDPAARGLTGVGDKLFFVGVGDTDEDFAQLYCYRAGQPLARLRSIGQPASLVGTTLTVDGTDGDDDIRLSLTGSTYTLTFNARAPQTYSTAAVNRFLIRGADGNDRITLQGPINNATLLGGAAADTLIGSSGNDVLDGGEDADSILGNAGNDTLRGGADDLWVGGDDDTVDGGAGNDLVYAGGNAGSLSGGAGNDSLVGADRDDTLLGGDGNDTLFGGLGADRLGGGRGSDSLNGWKGYDTADYSDRTENLNLSLDAVANDGAAGETDNLLSVETIWGGSGNDSIVGSANADALVGNAGNDSIYGGGGNDTLTGGLGVDVLDGGRGNDVFYSGNDGGVRDYLTGGKGTDRANVDRKDVRSLIEELFA